MTRNYFFAAYAAVLLSHPAAAIAADAPPAPLTLAQALQRAQQPREDVYLAVGADVVKLLKDATPPDPDARVPQVAAAYGEIVRDFHGVTAIAPPTMTLLNTNPGKPNPYDGMPPPDAFKLLAASLEDGQWKMLTGDQGLGLSDLTTDAQRQLFTALFPGKEATLYPRKGGVLVYGGEDEKTLLKLPQADALKGKLHVRRRVQISVNGGDRPESGITADAPETASGVYQMYNGDFGSNTRDTIYGVKLRAVVPNTLKAADLDYDASIFSAPIDLTHVTTVGDLIARIGYATQMEFYADRRLEKRPVTALGAPSARAKDLLAALALCVAGTYRKVGAAYILTNDLMGEGTRGMILTRFVQEANMMRQATIAASGDKIYLGRSFTDLSTQDNVFSLNDAEKETLFAPSNSGHSTEVPFRKLTPAQQTAITKIVQDWNKANPPTPDPQDSFGQVTVPTGEYPILLMAATAVSLETPAFPTPIVLDSYLQTDRLMEPSAKLRDEMEKKRQEDEQRKAIEEAKAHPQPEHAAPKPPQLAEAFRPFSRRAVIARPRTVKDVDDIVADMKTLGFNELWLDAFSEGQNHLGENDAILKESLAKAKNAGISVSVRMDILNWGASAPKDSQDLTMLGETSAEASVSGQRRMRILDLGMSPDEADRQPTPLKTYVSPGASSTTETLTGIVQRIAATPGVTGIALRETSVHGYDRPFRSQSQAGDYSLGYTPALRLDFLRRDHVDPVDLAPDTFEAAVDVDTSVPEFDDWGIEINAQHDWSDYRADLLHAFLTRLWRTARSSGAHPMDVFVKAQRTLEWRADWYGRWDDPGAPLPTLTEQQSRGVDGDQDFSKYAHARWRANIYNLIANGALEPNELAWSIANIAPGWDGFALDITSAENDPLAPLIKTKAATKSASTTEGNP
ncbi:hypothetical protein CCAX7_18930 [Capsulimonas corticalis]|uniref:Uncharacterized protein n=1 Tax=Capsulimonas corticalis TaxID=2219043 RepID=A0A402D5A8_9BACT|nr:hypothetical protein [Capsulimonas corticalis]BDI29842.1 hypothetical protein CCAX7_18930 [Capsulimonas corticalis]